MPPTLAQRKWVQDALQVIKLSDHQEIEEASRKDSLRGEIAGGIQQIDEQLAGMTEAVDTFFDAYRQGLHTFGIAMLDAPMDDKEAASAADIAFKIFMGLAAAAFPEEALAAKLGEKLVERVGKVGEELAKKAASSLKELTTGSLEKARDLVKGEPKPGARTFREFAKALGDASVPTKAASKEAVRRGGTSTKEAFSQIATAAGTIEGPAEGFIRLMVSASRTFSNLLKASSDPNQLEAMFATEFAGKAGRTPPEDDSPIGRTRDAGTLYFEITAVTDMRADKPGFFLGNDTDSTWKLVMLGNKRDAEGAARALTESVKAPWKIPLPRKVRITVYDKVNERDHSICDGWLVFGKSNTGTSPDGFEELTGSYWGGETGRKPQEWLALAWGATSVRAAATSNEELEGAVH